MASEQEAPNWVRLAAPITKQLRRRQTAGMRGGGGRLEVADQGLRITESMSSRSAHIPYTNLLSVELLSRNLVLSVCMWAWMDFQPKKKKGAKKSSRVGRTLLKDLS